MKLGKILDVYYYIDIKTKNVNFSPFEIRVMLNLYHVILVRQPYKKGTRSHCFKQVPHLIDLIIAPARCKTSAKSITLRQTPTGSS